MTRNIAADQLPEDPVGLFYAWWRGDPLPDLVIPAGLAIEREPDRELIERVAGLPGEEIEGRFRRGDRSIVARISGEPAGIGWSSEGEVSIGELGLLFTLASEERYLWDFVTLPAWRGRNIYPALLQTFLAADAGARRFWVGHDLANVASARGIAKAGFQTVGEVYDLPGAGPVFVTRAGHLTERAPPAAALLGIPLLKRNEAAD